MKKKFNKELQLAGHNPGYSGKDKIFYVNGLPTGNLLADIEEAGFKVIQRINLK